MAQRNEVARLLEHPVLRERAAEALELKLRLLALAERHLEVPLDKLLPRLARGLADDVPSINVFINFTGYSKYL